LAVVPWKIQASATTFLTFLGSYVAFIAPLIAIMMYVKSLPDHCLMFYLQFTSVNYFFVRKGNIHVSSLYNGTSRSPYWYYQRVQYSSFCRLGLRSCHGYPRACWILRSKCKCGEPSHVHSWVPSSSTTGGLIYFILTKIWPVQIYPDPDMSSTEFEQMGQNDGYLDDDIIIGVESVEGNLEAAYIHDHEKI